MRSLQTRLGVPLLLALVMVFGLLWLVVSSAIRTVAEDYIAARLEHESETLLAAILFDEQGDAVIDVSRIDAIFERPFSGHYYQVFVNDDVISSRSLWDQQLFTTPPLEGRLHIGGPQQQALLVVSRHYVKQDTAISILVAEALTELEANIAVFQRQFSLVAGVMLVVLIALNIASIRRGLRPLQVMRDEVSALEQGDREQLNEQVPTEVAPLVEEVNRLVMLLGNRLRRSRQSLGDLAHALKKPLTILQHLERDEAIQSHPETLQALSHQVQSMQEIIERQLRRARLAGEGHAALHFDAGKEIPVLIDALKRMHSEKPLIIDIAMPERMMIKLDREDMLELLGNLLDNACKWARQQVKLTLSLNGDFNLCIEDDGNGVDDSALENLSRRGVRLDESVPGHGLGLAIVKDIVEHYRGEIRFSRSSVLGGLAVDVLIHVAR